MLIVENTKTNNSSEKHTILAHAQTISNFFVEALDQNDCNVKVVIGFYQEMDDTINSIYDLDKAVNPTKLKEYPNRKRVEDLSKVEDFLEVPSNLGSEVVVQAAVKALKDRCFDCKFEMPKLTINNDLKFLFNKLQLQLDVFENSFKLPNHVNFCHASFWLQKVCIPDLVKLIGTFLTGYAAIMALNKLPSISLGVFIKGIISTLLIKLVGSVNVSLDIMSTGLPCVINIFKELASKTPTNDVLFNSLSEDQNNDSWTREYISIAERQKELEDELEVGNISSEEYTRLLAEYTKQNDPMNYYLDNLDKQVGIVDDNMSQVFGFINDTIEQAQGDINSYIDSILGVINFLECEGKRSGTDFSDLLAYIAQLNSVINMISSLVAVLLQKTIKLELCKDEKSLKDISEIIADIPNTPLTPEDLADIIEEFLEKEAEVSEDGLSVLIYDKPKRASLPKLTLLGCNFKEFAEAHSIDNLVKTTIDNFLEEEKEKEREFQAGQQDPIKFTNKDPVWRDYTNIVFVPDSNINIPKNNSTNKYDKYIAQLGTNSKTDLDKIHSNDLGSKVFPPISKETLDKVKDTIKKYSKDKTTLIPIQDIIKYFPNNPEVLIPIKDYVDSITKIEEHEKKVIDIVEVGAANLDKTQEGFLGDLDELLDFIYNNPFGKEEGVSESIPGVLNKDGQADLNLNNVFKSNNEELKKQQNKYSPSTDECRSVEDILSVLNNIKI